MSISRSEWGVLIIASIVLGFVFGFDDGREAFEVGYWIGNLLIAIGIGLLSLLIMVYIEKRAARKFSCDMEVRTWSMTRLWLTTAGEFRGPVRSVPVGVIIPCLLTLLSNGWVKFAAVTGTEMKIKPARRIGFRYPQGSELEIAVMNSIGPVMLMVIGVLAKAVMGETHLADLIIKTNIFTGLASMFPLPGLRGIRVFFGAPLMFIFIMTMMIIITLSINIVPPVVSVLLGIVIGLGVMGARYYAAVLK